MKLTIDLPDEPAAVLAAGARERGLSAEEYASLLDDVVSLAFSERRHQT